MPAATDPEVRRRPRATGEAAPDDWSPPEVWVRRDDRPMESVLRVLDAAGIAVAVWTADGTVDYASHAARRLLGPRTTDAEPWRQVGALAASLLDGGQG